MVTVSFLRKVTRSPKQVSKTKIDFNSNFDFNGFLNKSITMNQEIKDSVIFEENIANNDDVKNFSNTDVTDHCHQTSVGISHLTQLEQYIKKFYPNINGSDFITLVDIIYMAAMRNNIQIPYLLDELYKGILDIHSFMTSNNGNIYNYLKNSKFKLFASRIKDIVVGSNGGMANVGKGEWFIALLSGINPNTDKPYVNIIKNGQGDIKYLDKNEEVKWNLGKVSVEKPGSHVNKNFNTLIDIEDKKWVPFRVKDKGKYSAEEIKRYNGIFWKAISGDEISILSDDELKQNIISMSFSKVFENSDSFIMFNDDGNFQRFRNIQDANIYYSDKLHFLTGKFGFECRARQKNPIALYCHVF